MKIKKPPPDRFSFQAARGVLRKFCFPKNLPDSGWCSHNIGEHFPINHQPRHSSLIKSLYGNSVCNYGKKKRTVTSFAYKSFENSPSVLKFLLELLFGIIKHHWKNRCPALNSLGIIDFLKVLVRWSEIQHTHIRIFKEWINKFKKTALNLVRFWWNLKWK